MQYSNHDATAIERDILSKLDLRVLGLYNMLHQNSQLAMAKPRFKAIRYRFIVRLHHTIH
jgi:hypothetical protein